MTVTQNEAFFITGIAVRTSNQPGKAEKDIPLLWNKFLSDNIAGSIPGKTSDAIYCVYTAYEQDFTKPYTTVLGCRVEENALVPQGHVKVLVPAGNYQLFTATGNIQAGIVLDAWMAIWNTPLQRTYAADFELYAAKAQNPANAEVDIFVGIK